MSFTRALAAFLLLAALMMACATTPARERGRVVCPACGAEFDAIFEKRF
jgi:hypothetical protein